MWLACVGVSDSYVQGRIDTAGYAAFALDLRRRVRRVYPDDAVERAGRALYAEDLEGDNGVGGGAFGKTRVSLCENGRILIHRSELRLFLLRHTSLWDSLTLSPYACPRMGLWNRGGREDAREMMARMGIPLAECRQPYAFVSPKIKRRLRERMEECSGVSFMCVCV